MMSATIKKLVEVIGLELRQRGLKLATAESCTGGGLGYWITHLSGSSDWYERGFITYSNAAKIEMLGVNPLTLETNGAVSEQAAREMAEGALQHSTADWSIAVTGIAGPTGGSSQKPVGTVWIAWARRNFTTEVEINIFSGDRENIRSSAIKKALEGIAKRISLTDS